MLHWNMVSCKEWPGSLQWWTGSCGNVTIDCRVQGQGRCKSVRAVHRIVSSLDVSCLFEGNFETDQCPALSTSDKGVVKRILQIMGP